MVFLLKYIIWGKHSFWIQQSISWGEECFSLTWCLNQIWSKFPLDSVSTFPSKNWNSNPTKKIGWLTFPLPLGCSSVQDDKMKNDFIYCLILNIFHPHIILFFKPFLPLLHLSDNTLLASEPIFMQQLDCKVKKIRPFFYRKGIFICPQWKNKKVTSFLWNKNFFVLSFKALKIYEWNMTWMVKCVRRNPRENKKKRYIFSLLLLATLLL